MRARKPGSGVAPQADDATHEQALAANAGLSLRSPQKVAKPKKEKPDRFAHLRPLLAGLPTQPGVYQYFDAEGKLLYVGKAKNLNSRVRSYFQNSPKEPRIARMVAQIADIQLNVTDTEVEALLLESNMVKAHQPRYNILLRDDKNFIYLKITTGEDYPRLLTTRRVEKDNHTYIGPKTNAGALRETIRLLRSLFPLRDCSMCITALPAKDEDASTSYTPIGGESGKIYTDSASGRRVLVQRPDRKVPCLDFHIKRCSGPCAAKIAPDDYRQTVAEVVRLLRGEADELLEKLRTRMMEAAAERRYEEAAKHRDRLRAVEAMLEKQKITGTDVAKSCDVLGYWRTPTHTYWSVLTIRGGRLTGQETMTMDTGEASAEEALEGFLLQYYAAVLDHPRELYLPLPLADARLVEEALAQLAGRSMRTSVPQIGEKKRLCELAGKNAFVFGQQSIASWQHDALKEQAASENAEALATLAALVGRDELPVIECIDISHMQGRGTNASLVSFTHGAPDTDNYRHYNIRTLKSGEIDDYASIREVVMRRLQRLDRELAEHTADGTLEQVRRPSLLLIDGGLGQLHAAQQAAAEYMARAQHPAELQQVAIASVVKPRSSDKRETDSLLLPNGMEQPLPARSPLWRLVAHMRDEAHRFAIGHTRKRHTKELLASRLEQVRGVGPVLRRRLVAHFGSEAAVFAAQLDEIAAIAGDAVARQILGKET